MSNKGLSCVPVLRNTFFELCNRLASRSGGLGQLKDVTGQKVLCHQKKFGNPVCPDFNLSSMRRYKQNKLEKILPAFQGNSE